MRRARRGIGGGHEFGGSGEDSFVAVVVTKLTGALLFILLLAMVIMALIPRAIDAPAAGPGGVTDAAEASGIPLEVATPGELPEAIVGRPYTLALAATGGRGPVRWSVGGPLPAGLALDADAGLIRGVATAGTPDPLPLVLTVIDGDRHASRDARLVVFESDRPLGLPSEWAPRLPAVPWRAWLDRGFGFLLLALVHMVGMNAVAGLGRRALERAGGPAAADGARRRFAAYRTLVRLGTILAGAALAALIARPPS